MSIFCLTFVSDKTIKTNDMKTVELNNENCKEYTTEELERKLGLENDFDLDVLFSEEDTKEESEDNELTDFQKLTIGLLNKAKEELEKWKNKEYKQTKGSVWVGDEIEGGNYSFNYINNKKRMNAIKNAMMDIDTYTKDLKESGYKFDK